MSAAVAERTDVTLADLFCGAGGSLTGMENAGYRVVVGANHSPRSIETASTNHPDTEFLCTDINHYDMRRLPHTDVLWASVICTELSPAGGNKKHRGQGRLDLEEQGHVPNDTYERTRACALDVIRATEVHRYKAIIVENVVEFARDWELYDWWVEGMVRLGYHVQTVNVSAAHVYDDTNEPAPQWRDRIYIVFTLTGIRRPNLELRPPAWCDTCDHVVEAVQWWKRDDRRRVGKYGQQYLYRCPKDLTVVEPYVLPAAAALDLADVGQRIGDREKPLASNTMARIEWGLIYLAWPVLAQVAGNTYERPGYYRAWPATSSPMMTRQATGCDAVVGPIMVNHAHDDTRVYPAAAGPLPTRTQKIGDGVATPFVTMLRTNELATPIDAPLNALATRRHHFLTTPPGAFYVKNYGGNAKPANLAKPLSEPFSPITTIDHHALVIPYRKGHPKRITEPLHTIATRVGEGILQPAIDPMDCYYRTCKPLEHKRAQRFDDDYVITGNIGEQTMQAGNAVPVNVAQWVGKQLLEVL